MERKNRRNFKVYESSVSSSSGYGYYSTRYKSVPQIRMQGKWLEELGLESGSEINVECLDGKLIITKKKQKLNNNEMWLLERSSSCYFIC